MSFDSVCHGGAQVSKVTVYKCKPPLKGTIRVCNESIDGTVYAECDYEHTDWPKDHPERWVGDAKRVSWSWVERRVEVP